jgi:hypothetical protein
MAVENHEGRKHVELRIILKLVLEKMGYDDVE